MEVLKGIFLFLVFFKIVDMGVLLLGVNESVVNSKRLKLWED